MTIQTENLYAITSGIAPTSMVGAGAMGLTAGATGTGVRTGDGTPGTSKKVGDDTSAEIPPETPEDGTSGDGTSRTSKETPRAAMTGTPKIPTEIPAETPKTTPKKPDAPKVPVKPADTKKKPTKRELAKVKVLNDAEQQLEMLKEENYKRLFDKNNPIYTREYNTTPTVYGKKASINRCYITNGCNINGNVSNSILGRNVIVEEGAVINNSIILVYLYLIIVFV